MKAITLWQPWASMVVVCEKQYETRSWATKYRGPIAIHAAARWNKDAGRLCRLPPFYGLLRRHGLTPETLPLGMVLGVADLVAVLEITPAFIERLSEQERALGWFEPGRFAWKLERVRQFQKPVKATGQQTLWEWSTQEARRALRKERI